MGHDFLTEGVESSDDGDFIHGCWSHGEIWLVALSLTVVLLVTFNVDDVWDIRCHEPLGSFCFVIMLEVLVEDRICRVSVGNLLPLELFKKPALKESGPEYFFAEFWNVFIIDTLD